MDSIILHTRAILSTTTARWQTLLSVVAPDLLDRHPAPGAWSVIDCLCHLLDTERLAFPVRIKAILAGQDFPAFDPDQEGSQAEEAPVQTLFEEFARLRAENLALISALSLEDLPKTARHAELGIVTLEQLLNEWVAHDLSHTVQAEESLMQPFIVGCGPWRFYFKAQDAELRQ
jgi:uncharacterized damage-inducible protein DinB